MSPAFWEYPADAGELGHLLLQGGVRTVLAKLMDLGPGSVEIVDRELGEQARIHAAQSTWPNARGELLLWLSFEVVDMLVSGEAPTLVDLDQPRNPWTARVAELAQRLAADAPAGPGRSRQVQVRDALAIAMQLVEPHRAAIEELALRLKDADIGDEEVTEILKHHGVEPLPLGHRQELGLA